MKNELKVLFLIFSVVLCICGFLVTLTIYHAAPFYDTKLLFFDVVIFLFAAASLATAMLASSK